MHWVYMIMNYDVVGLQVYKVVLLGIHNCVDVHWFGVEKQCTMKWVVVAVQARWGYPVQIEQLALSYKVVQ